jgi:predicted transcriptional regulator
LIQNKTLKFLQRTKSEDEVPLEAAKINLINNIRAQPDAITKALNRNRSAVYRDIHEMEQFDLVKTHEEINLGHGRHKIVELVPPTAIKLEAYI